MRWPLGHWHMNIILRCLSLHHDGDTATVVATVLFPYPGSQCEYSSPAKRGT